MIESIADTGSHIFIIIVMSFVAASMIRLPLPFLPHGLLFTPIASFWILRLLNVDALQSLIVALFLAGVYVIFSQKEQI